MSHQILLAPAWAAAEAWLLDRIAGPLSESPLSRARVVVPSFNLARHLEERLIASGVEGFFGRIFTTLPGLVRELLDESPRDDRPVPASRALRLWGISRMVREKVPEDGEMGRIRHFPGFVAAVDDLIQELQQACIDPEALASLGQRRGSSRLQNLGRIYADYWQMLRAHGWTDAVLEMRASVEAIRVSETLRGFDPLIVYGFDDFTAIQFTVVKALTETHPGVSFVVPFDPDRQEAFSSVENTLRRLEKVTDAPPVSLPVPPSDGSTLSHAQRRVFAPPSSLMAPDEDVQVVTASGPAQMVEAIARQLRRLRRDDPSLRWRDCAVVFRSLSPYRRLINETFPRFGIPFDLPVGTPWGEVRVLTFLRGVLGLKINGFAKEALLACLRSAHCRIQIDPVDLTRLASLLPPHASPEALAERLRQMIEERGRRVAEPSEDDPSPADTRRIEDLRATAAGVGSAFGKAAGLPDRGTLAQYAAGVREVAGALIRLPELLPGEDLPLEARWVASDHRALDEFEGRLRALGRAWPHEISFADFLNLLDLLIQEEVLHDPPPRTDAVAFHDALAARGLSFRVVIVAGLMEKEFPALDRPGPFLNEEEQEALVAQAGPDAHLLSSSDRAAKERLLFVSALQAARERLYLVCTNADADGRPTVVSPFLEEVRGLFTSPEDPERDPMVARAYTMAHVLPSDSEDLWHLEEAAMWGLYRMYQGEGLTPEGALLLSDLLGRGPLSGGLIAEVTRWHDPHFTGFDGDLSGDGALLDHLRRTWTGRPLSPTKLDSYGKCPYQFFAGQVLGLEAPEKERMEITPLDRGSLVHRILERFYRERWDASSERARPVTEGEETEATAAILRIAEEVCAAFEQQGRVGHPGAWAYEKRHLMVRLGWFIRSEIEYFKKNPGLAPAHLEFSFGVQDHRGADPASTDDPLTLSSRGAEIHARGIIDRIDAFPDRRAMVIDYKTGRSVPAYGDVYAGISFQLVVYLLSAERLLGFHPGSGFYLLVAQPPGARGGLSQSGQISCGEKPGRKGQLNWLALRERVLAFLSAYASDISAGHFPVLPVDADPEGKACRYCGFRSACRVDETRLILGKVEDTGRFARTQRMNLSAVEGAE